MLSLTVVIFRSYLLNYEKERKKAYLTQNISTYCLFVLIVLICRVNSLSAFNLASILDSISFVKKVIGPCLCQLSLIYLN